MSESKTYVDCLMRQSQGSYGAGAHVFQNNGVQVGKSALMLHAWQSVLAHSRFQFLVSSLLDILPVDV